MELASLFTRLACVVALGAWLPAAASAQGLDPSAIEPVERLLSQTNQPDGARPSLAESAKFIRAKEAREAFGVTGKCGAAAILDTGLRTTHVDFEGRVVPGRNFTGGAAQDVSDPHGHGTNVAGIVAANGVHEGIAPCARLVPLKVLDDQGGGSFEWVEEALQWILDRPELEIRVVNLSLGDGSNLTDDASISAADGLRTRVAELRRRGVAVVVAAGNDFFEHQSREGMGYPAVLRETISVGAVYDGDIGSEAYAGGAVARLTAAGQITPFSQRLHPSTHAAVRTDVFAPGAPVTASGSIGDQARSTQSGTSQAAPVTSGIVLLLNEYYRREAGSAPSVDQIEAWLRTGVAAVDDYGDRDNVGNTGKSYERLDAVRALCEAHRALLAAGRAAETPAVCAEP